MSSVFNVFNISSSAMTAQSIRLNTVASNLANVDSIIDETGQPYRSKQVVFQAVPTTTDTTNVSRGVRVNQIVESAAPPRLVYEPNNPAANADGYVEYPNVNVVEEMTNMISSSRSYQSNVEVMNTAKNLVTSTLRIGQE